MEKTLKSGTFTEKRKKKIKQVGCKREVRILDYLRTGSHGRQAWGEKLKFFGMLGKK